MIDLDWRLILNVALGAAIGSVPAIAALFLHSYTAALNFKQIFSAIKSVEWAVHATSPPAEDDY